MERSIELLVLVSALFDVRNIGMRTTVSFLFYGMRKKLIRTFRESPQKLVVGVGEYKSHPRIPYFQCRTQVPYLAIGS